MRGFVLVVALTRLGHAFVLDGRFPSETDAARIYDEPEQPAITAPPSVKELLRRAEVATVLIASDNICGYFNGSSASPYSCINSAETCAIFTTGGGGVPACCASDECYFATACVDSASICTGKCLTETATLKCTGTKLPYCGTVTFSSGISDFYCVANNRSAVQQAQTTYSGQIGGGFAPIAITLSDSSSSRPASSSSPTTSSRTTSASTSAGPATTTASNDDRGSEPAAPIGAIVGGVIGGVALLATIGFGVWYVRKQNRNKPDIAAAGATAGLTAGDAADQGGSGPFGQSPQSMVAVPAQQSPYYPVAASPLHTGPNGVPNYRQGQDKPVGFVSVSPNATGAAPDRDMNMSPMSVATELDSNPATMVHEMPSTPATKTQPHELA